MERPTFTDEELIAALTGEAPRELADAAARAGASDPALRERQQFLAALIARVEGAAGLEALFGVDRARVDRLAAATALRPGLAARAGAAARELVATLLLDSSRGGPALAGYRSTGGGRQLVFEADGIGVSVRIEPARPAIEGVSAGEVRVLGWVAGISGGGTVAVRGEDSPAQSAALDEDGFFELAVPPGTYSMEIASDAATIVTPPVHFSA